MSENVKKWYVLRAIGGKEKKVKEYIENEIANAGLRVDEMAESGEEMNIPFVVGETVKVIDGPFNGFNGIIEKINEEKKKLEVMVKIFGRKTPLELSFMQVEKE